MRDNYYQSLDSGEMCGNRNQGTISARLLLCAIASILACLAAAAAYDSLSRLLIAPQVPLAARAGPLLATTRGSPFSFGKKVDDDDLPPAKPSFFGSKAAAPVPSKPAPRGNEALENVVRVTGVGAKVVSELALYLAFNTGYFITNTYQFLTKEEQQKLARETVDKQLPELLSLLGGTTEVLGKTASTVAASDDFKDLQKTAAETAEQLTKNIKSEAPAPEVIDKLKKIVADEKGEVISEERKAALAEILKQGGVKGAELSLYLFYNVFSVLRNLDRVLPTPEQTGGIEDKIKDLEVKAADLAQSVKELPSQSGKIVEKVERLKESIPTAQDLANLDPAEVSLSVRSSLASAKTTLDQAVNTVNAQLKEDSEFRKTLKDVSTQLQPVTNAVGSLVAKLPLPKNPDGSIDYGRLLAESGIITIKGIKALIEATRKAAASISSKTSGN